MSTLPSSSSVYLATARQWITQFPPVEWAVGRVRETLMGALRQGPVPQHIAFVMDGNRRFARNQRIETVEGHNRGFEALARILEVCYKSGVRVVTIYAFSVENFHRSQYEVEGLMALAKLKLTQIAQHGDLLARYGARIRILGQREMLRADVLEVVERVEELTKGNGDAVLNVCFPYASRNEIATAVKGVVEEWSRPVMGKERGFSEAHISRAIRSRHISAGHEGAETEPVKQDQPPEANEKLAPQPPSDTDSHSSLASSSTLHPSAANTPLPSQEKLSFPDPEAINASTLNLHMLTAENPPLDLLVRTSGVARFSDFMLWQAHENAEVVFAECLWPEFDLWHFLPILVEWQWRRRREAREGRKREKRAKVKAR